MRKDVAAGILVLHVDIGLLTTKMICGNSKPAVRPARLKVFSDLATPGLPLRLPSTCFRFSLDCQAGIHGAVAKKDQILTDAQQDELGLITTPHRLGGESLGVVVYLACRHIDQLRCLVAIHCYVDSKSQTGQPFTEHGCVDGRTACAWIVAIDEDAHCNNFILSIY